MNIRLPETIFVPSYIRKALVIIFFYGGIINAVVFLFLFLTLFHGYDPFQIKSLI